MTVQEKLSQLRESMRKRDITAYIIVTDDFHGSEYVGDYFKAREFMSGFTGSAGTLVVTNDWAGLWTDGRYFLQAGAQLQNSTIELMREREKDVPTIPQFLKSKLAAGDTVGFDGRTVSSRFVERLEKELGDMDITYKCDEDLVDAIWRARPALSKKPLWELDVKFTGLTRDEKLSQVREKMRREDSDILVLTALDEIAWLLNLRGDDTECCPVFLSFMIITQDNATLCVQEDAVNQEIRDKLEKSGVGLAPYDSIYDKLQNLRQGSSVWLDGNTANYRIKNCVPDGVKLKLSESPVVLMKAVKTPEEIKNMMGAHVKDGVAVTRFIYWLKRTVGHERITELSAADKLLEFRQEQEDFIGSSFNPIIAYGAHGAIIHYSATPETDMEFEPRGFCLADTGGHYLEGSTDITRTIALGQLTDEEIRAYTLVLRGHLNLAYSRFLYGCCGADIDILARMPLWERGMDYNHGTGHGVGYLLNIHEGPQSIHWRISDGGRYATLEDGMVTSNEPGLYVAGKFGIRHENLEVVRKGESTEFGQFMYLEPLTMVPFDKDAIDVSLMTDTDIERLNNYHKVVYENLSPYFSGEELKWLASATSAIVK